MSGTYTHTIILSNPTIQNPFTVGTYGLVTVAAGDGIIGTAGLAWTLSNFGTISTTATNGDGVDLTAGGSFVNGARSQTMALVSGAVGVALQAAGTITNYGTITGSAEGIVTVAAGVVTNFGLVSGGINGGSSISNFGTVFGGVRLDAPSTLNNGANGSTGALVSGLNFGIDLAASGTDVTNFATVTGVAFALYENMGSGNETITNFSLMSGSIGLAVADLHEPGGKQTNIINYLEITGTNGTGVRLSGSGAETLTNFGKITGQSGTAVSFGYGADRLVVEPGAIFNGVISGFNALDTIDIAHETVTGVTVAIWEISGLAVAASALVGFADPASWQIAGTGDYNGDGKADILWRQSSGNVAIWEMNGTSLAASPLPGFADPAAWTIAPPTIPATRPPRRAAATRRYRRRSACLSPDSALSYGILPR